jgi:hypothetical protein
MALEHELKQKAFEFIQIKEALQTSKMTDEVEIIYEWMVFPAHPKRFQGIQNKERG